MTRWPVHADGAEVGFVTSAIYSPRLTKNIGYAMVPAARGELGAHLTIAVSDGDERRATVRAQALRGRIERDSEVVGAS